MIYGNLAAGILVGIKNLYPKIKVIGVIYEEFNIEKFNINSEEFNNTFDYKISLMAFDICNAYLNDIIKVDSYDIDNAIEIIYNDTNVVVKSNGALSTAGIYKYTKKHNIQNKNIIGITNNWYY